MFGIAGQELLWIAGGNKNEKIKIAVDNWSSGSG